MDTLTNKQTGLLRDHTDARMVTAEPNEIAADRNQIVQLDPDHPGFRDASYRARRNEIARRADTPWPGARSRCDGRGNLHLESPDGRDRVGRFDFDLPRFRLVLR